MNSTRNWSGWKRTEGEEGSKQKLCAGGSHDMMQRVEVLIPKTSYLP